MDFWRFWAARLEEIGFCYYTQSYGNTEMRRASNYCTDKPCQ